MAEESPAAGAFPEHPPVGHLNMRTRLPYVTNDEAFSDVVQKLFLCFVDMIDAQQGFEQLRAVSIGRGFEPLIENLSQNRGNSTIVAALLTLKWHFSTVEPDDRGINETRGFACEIVAWRFLTPLSERERIDYLLCELPCSSKDADQARDVECGRSNGAQHLTGPSDEATGLLSGQVSPQMSRPRSSGSPSVDKSQAEDEPAEMADAEWASPFEGLNALEIAAVAGAKKFLSHRVMQRIVDGIWNGNIVFWESMNTHSRKKALIYNIKKADPYCRLRVPKYQKAFEVFFFAIFLALYYAVLVERNPRKITPIEILLFIWIAAFAYEEFGEFEDAGTLFYATDFWSLWDVGIVCVGAAYLVTREYILSYACTLQFEE
ncbi:MAG: hypothetical protein M1827_002492 [Pycnora praestabilis]|nr:MAG: hypothetical protein M1827_002492 [Pycnora praestabilis]